MACYYRDFNTRFSKSYSVTLPSPSESVISIQLLTSSAVGSYFIPIWRYVSLIIS